MTWCHLNDSSMTISTYAKLVRKQVMNLVTLDYISKKNLRSLQPDIQTLVFLQFRSDIEEKFVMLVE